MKSLAETATNELKTMLTGTETVIRNLQSNLQESSNNDPHVVNGLSDFSPADQRKREGIKQSIYSNTDHANAIRAELASR